MKQFVKIFNWTAALMALYQACRIVIWDSGGIPKTMFLIFSLFLALVYAATMVSTFVSYSRQLRSFLLVLNGFLCTWVFAALVGFAAVGKISGIPMGVFYIVSAFFLASLPFVNFVFLIRQKKIQKVVRLTK